MPVRGLKSPLPGIVWQRLAWRPARAGPSLSTVCCRARFVETEERSILLINMVCCEDSQGSPALSLLLWEDGAPFDWLMNDYMGWEFPIAIDPRVAPPLLSNSSFVAILQQGSANSTILQSMLSR